MDDWLTRLPKAELHLHIEGSLQPEMLLDLAQRNAVTLPWDDIDQVRAAYQFDDLQSFLDLYYQGMSVLLTERDFHDLAMAYFHQARADGVLHADISFDPQAHLVRGIALDVPFAGLLAAMHEAEADLGISSSLVMSFLRDRSPAEAMEVLAMAQPWYDHIAAVGLDSAERNHPPRDFTGVFRRAKELGLSRTAHAGEEGPAAYISEALDVLNVDRIDHGVRCVEDPALVARLRESRTHLTVCPLSNVALHVVEKLADHQLPQLLAGGLNVGINSDDPAYLGGSILENFVACRDTFNLDRATLKQLSRNALEAAFMPAARRATLLQTLAAH